MTISLLQRESVSPAAVDWSQLLPYSNRITRLHLNVAVDDKFPRCLRALHETSGIHLCPNVQRVEISSDRGPPITCILNGSSLLRSATVEGYGEKVIVPAIEELTAVSPQIKSITVWNNDRYGPPLNANLGGFFDLEVAELDETSWATWNSLSGCSQLHKLTVTHALNPQQQLAFASHDGAGAVGAMITFPLLQTLSIHETYSCSIPLSGTSMPCLHHIRASYLNDPTEGICVGLAQQSRRLETVQLGLWGGRVSSRTIEAFAALPHLRVLELSGSAQAMEVSDGDVDLLARSRPELQILTLDIELEEGGSGCRLTASSLFSLARNCPSLTELTLRLDLSAFNAGIISAAPSPPRDLKTTLHVPDMIEPDDLRQLAKFLSAYYLDCTVRPSSLLESMRKYWEES